MSVKSNQSGRSMIEMLGVLAIIGVLSVGGIAGYSKAMTKFRINKTVDQVSQLAQNIRTLYGSQKNYSSLSASVIKKAHLAPDEMFETSGSTTMTNPFGGSVWVSHHGKNSLGDTKAFIIGYGGIPQEACIDILTQNWGTGSSSGLIAFGDDSGIYVAYLGCNGSEVYTCADDGVMDVVKAVSTCDSTTNNRVDWKFY